MKNGFNYLSFELKDHSSSAYFETLSRFFQKKYGIELEYINELKAIKVDCKYYEKLLAAIIKDHPNFEAKKIDKFFSKNKRDSIKDYKYNDITKKLLKEKVIFESEVNGLFIESIEYTEAKRLLDRFFKKNINVINNKILEFEVPSIINKKTVSRTGYIDKFSDILMQVIGMSSEAKESEEFIVLDQFLSPTVCFRIFPLIREIIKEQAEFNKGFYPICITSKAQCFRNERINKELTLMRLNEFSMREYIFIGEQEDINSLVVEFNKITCSLLEKLKIENYLIEDANDAFFIGAYRMNSKYQKLFKLKQEYVLELNKGNLSFISTNYHKETLLKSFNILDIVKENLKKPSSACIGIGLDRLMLILLNIYGKNPKNLIEKLKFLLTED